MKSPRMSWRIKAHENMGALVGENSLEQMFAFISWTIAAVACGPVLLIGTFFVVTTLPTPLGKVVAYVGIALWASLMVVAFTHLLRARLAAGRRYGLTRRASLRLRMFSREAFGASLEREQRSAADRGN